jgi:hypothetical protein
MSTVPYQIRFDDAGYHVVRPTPSGYFTVAGPYNTRYEAETEARRRWAHGSRRAA